MINTATNTAGVILTKFFDSGNSLIITAMGITVTGDLIVIMMIIVAITAVIDLIRKAKTRLSNGSIRTERN